MTPLAFDTETSLIRPGLQAPPMVCVTWQRPGQEPGIAHVSDSEARIRGWLEDQDTLLIGHFAAYDAAVVCAQFPHLTPKVFAAYRSNRIVCTKKRQQLLDIAGGKFRGEPGEGGRWKTYGYRLDDLSRRLLGKGLQKDGWRLCYGEFLDVAISRWVERAKELQEEARQGMAWLGKASRGEAWQGRLSYLESKDLEAIVRDVPEGALRYPLEDARTTLDVYLAQEHHKEFLHDQYRQSYSDFVLHLSSAWGLRTYAPGVDVLETELKEAYSELEAELVEAGLVRRDGSRDTKRAKQLMLSVCKTNGLPVRRTDAHFKCEAGDACELHVALDADACAWVSGHDYAEGELLGKYAELVTLRKMLSNDITMLRHGTVYPVSCRYDLAETGRSTSSNPNIQNLNTGRVKDSKLASSRLRPGIRQAFVPRPGRVFIQADFPQLELFTLAQCGVSWLGHSKLAEALNGGLDPHLAVAATILGVTYEEAQAHKKRADVDAARQTAKVANFGFPGGLGVAKLIVYAKKSYGVELTEAKAKTLKEQWFATWPEMRDYFARVNGFFGDEVVRASVDSLFTQRRRGGVTYCAACNNGFQGLGADCAKAALCLVAEAEYCDTKSPLFGARTVAFVHDEIIAECDEAACHEAAHALAGLMVVGANRYLPDVPIPVSKMEPVAMRVWSKGAKQVWAEGKLVPWAPST